MAHHLPTGDHLPRDVRVLVTGAGGQLGRYLRPALVQAGAIVSGIGAHAGRDVDHVVDITDERMVRAAVSQLAPAIIVHAAAFTDVDGAEADAPRAAAVNAAGSANIAKGATDVGAYLIAMSTDFVFGGDDGAPYDEDAEPDPRSVYGKTKLDGEQHVLAIDGRNAVARTAWLYGGSGKHFPRTVVNVLRDRGSMEVVDDQAGSPTYAGDVADAVVQLAAVRGSGRFHLVNEGRATRYELARDVARLAGFAPSVVRPMTTGDFLAKYPLPAARPADSTLINRRGAALGVHLRPWMDAIADYGPRLAAELGAGVGHGGRAPRLQED